MKKIDPSSYAQHVDYAFGNDTFQSLQLCNMMSKQADGYYEILHERDLCQ